MTGQQAGQQLRRVRERLGLRYRDVEKASLQLAAARGNYEFSVGLSRLADIESKGTLPSIYRLYTLCAIYKLRFSLVLQWYGINLQELTADSMKNGLERTSLIEPDLGLEPNGEIQKLTASPPANWDRKNTGMLLSSSPELDPLRDLLQLLHSTGTNRSFRYAFVGLEDFSMASTIPPGSVIQIDETLRRLEFRLGRARPIYLLETREGIRLGWCRRQGHHLYVQVEPASGQGPFIYREPEEVDVVGQVVAVAKRMDPDSEPHAHYEVVQESLRNP